LLAANLLYSIRLIYGGIFMKKALITVAPGFEEIETITVIDILRRAEIDVVVAATEPGEITGSRGVTIVPDELLQNVVNNHDFDMIVLPGGLQGTMNLKSDASVKRIIQEMYEQGKYIAAICAAPIVLAEAGLTRGKMITSHPSVKEELRDISIYQESRVAMDGQIITSRSPGTAMEFAMTLVDILVGKSKREEINKGVLAKW
jgi:4-methyl-5(b-hydroxyethyl)-thiazole monophosphate biosynthesis